MAELERVLIDANVLYSRTLRDWMLMLAYCGSPGRLYHPLWTEDILAEVIANFRAQNPQHSGGYINRIVHILRTEFADCQVIDYEATASLPDPKDAHVHGAAISGNADYLVTQNVRDFVLTQQEQDALPYEIYTPDEFFMVVWDSQPGVVRSVHDQMEKYRRQNNSHYSLASLLKSAGAEKFSKVVAGLTVESMKKRGY